MDIEYQQANKQYRRKLFGSYLIGIVAVVFFSLLVKEWVLETHSKLYGVESIYFIELVSGILILIATLPAMYLIWFGKRIISDKKYPYEGMSVVMKTKVVRDSHAVSMGKRFIAFGIISISIIIISIFVNHKVNQDFIKNPFGYSPTFFWNK